MTRVALTQLLPEPVEVKLQGLAPWAEVRERYKPWFHKIVAPVGRLLTVKEAPEEQTMEGPEILYRLIPFKVLGFVPAGSSQ
jgi:hypothetical protein